MYIIYKLINKVNNKLYFGYTSTTLKARLQKHYSEPRNTIISRSLRKYGKENFIGEIICECDNKNDATFLEKFLIFHYKTNIIRHRNGNGMNMTDGGEGCEGYRHPEELKQKWSHERKGQFSGNKHPSWGKFGSDNPKSKKVYRFNKNGILLDEFGSVKEAGNKMNIDNGNISRCCRGIIKTLKGDIYQYEKIFQKRKLTPKYNKMLGKSNPRSKKVYVFDKHKKLILWFNSGSETGRHFNISRKRVCQICRSKRKQYNDLFLSYDEQLATF